MINMDTFYIKKGYICNLDTKGNRLPYLDDSHSSASFQIQVYKYAQRIIKKEKMASVLDIGCGYGHKLCKYIMPFCDDIVGIDTEHAITFCSNNYSFGEWHVDDIENPKIELNRKFDLIICSDVIEHLVNPNCLIRYIKKFCNIDTQIIISTPDRDKINGQSKAGPPVNHHHVREWNMTEFNSYIKSNKIMILKHFLLADKPPKIMGYIKKAILLESLKKIQIVHCRLHI